MRFDPADGSKPTQSTVKTGTLAAPPQQNPQREGFRFDGWTYNGQPFDLRTPILQDTTLKAQWTKTTDWALSPDHGPATGARLTISPPDMQEPQFASIQTSGEQIVGLTGDGRIYTWAQDGTPKQVPFPAQAPEGFRYLQAAAGSRWQAALGSDQHIYTWNNQQATPTILNTDQNAEFTGISISDDRLLAVDQQGQVHTFQASQDNSQGLNPKFTKQTTTSLPGQAQAVLTVASSNRTLIVDADGQAWTWDTNNTVKTNPERIKQDPDMRTVQAQALGKGFLLLNANGQVLYLTDSTTSATVISLQDGEQANRITANKDKAMITDKDGHIWAWQPGETPIRADNRKQAYVQAIAVGSRITAIDIQGSIFRWSLDAQGDPGKPARIDATQAPILETASMDSQPLKLTKKKDAWQTDVPTHNPGPSTILIAGRQDGKPFTRSFDYTVNQTLTRNEPQGPTYRVSFNTDGGSPKPEDQNFFTLNSRVKRPAPDPTRDGYQFDGWFIDNIAYDFSKPVTTDLTLNAHWTPNNQNKEWSISPGKGSQLGNETITITPPDTSRGIRFNQISGSKETTYSFSLAVGSDGNAYAWGDNRYGQLGDGTRTTRTTPVMVKLPDRKTYPDVPADFTYVQVSAGGSHSLALGSDGYAYAWGYNNYGQLGNNTNKGSPVPVRVRDPASPNDTSKGLKATQVSAGNSHSLALGSDGNVYAWGYNGYGQLGDNTTGSSYVPVRVRDPASPTDTSKGLQAVQVSAGYYHSLAVGSDGYAYAWGYNNYGQLGNNTKKDSPVPVRVRDPASPNDTSKGLKATQVSAGNLYSLALGSDGYAYAWGSKGSWLGKNTKKDSPVPVRVRHPASPNDTSEGLKAVQVSAGVAHSLALGSDGYVYAWGLNFYGQLGNNTKSEQFTPVKVFASAQSTSTAGPWLSAVLVNGGWYHSLAIGTDGNTRAWGWNYSGQLGNDSIPTGSSNDAKSAVPVPVAFNLTPVINGIRFDQTAVSGLTRGDGNSVTVLTPAHQPGTVTVSVDYTLGGAAQTPDTSLRYTYLPAGVLPQAGGEGILLALATGMTGMGGVLASRRHRREQRQLLHASHE